MAVRQGQAGPQAVVDASAGRRQLAPRWPRRRRVSPSAYNVSPRSVAAFVPPPCSLATICPEPHVAVRSETLAHWEGKAEPTVFLRSRRPQPCRSLRGAPEEARPRKWTRPSVTGSRQSGGRRLLDQACRQFAQLLEKLADMLKLPGAFRLAWLLLVIPGLFCLLIPLAFVPAYLSYEVIESRRRFKCHPGRGRGVRPASQSGHGKTAKIVGKPSE